MTTTTNKLPLDPSKIYLAASMNGERSNFKFYGVRRMAPWMGDDVEKDNYGVDESGINTCWPFDFVFDVTEDEILGHNDNCGSAYLITEVE